MDEVKEYCHYILSKGESKSLHAAAPKEYRRKKDVLDRFDNEMEYEPKRWRGFNSKLTRAIKWLLDESGLLQIRIMGEETYSIYMRCCNRIPTIDHVRNEYIIDYEEVFEILCDFIWIYVSQKTNSKESHKIELIDDFRSLRHGVKGLYGVLEELIDEAKCDCNAFKEAERLRHRIFPGSIVDERVRAYYDSDFGKNDFVKAIHDREEYTQWLIYLYFALIATSVRFEEIREG